MQLSSPIFAFAQALESCALSQSASDVEITLPSQMFDELQRRLAVELAPHLLEDPNNFAAIDTLQMNGMRFRRRYPGRT